VGRWMSTHETFGRVVEDRPRSHVWNGTELSVVCRQTRTGPRPPLLTRWQGAAAATLVETTASHRAPRQLLARVGPGAPQKRGKRALISQVRAAAAQAHCESVSWPHDRLVLAWRTI
jgi:hypothetical protein